MATVRFSGVTKRYRRDVAAVDELDLCVRRKGEISDVFLVDSATLRHFPPALYWLGRSHEALGNATAAQELYREYLSLRGGADPPGALVRPAGGDRGRPPPRAGSRDRPRNR